MLVGRVGYTGGYISKASYHSSLKMPYFLRPLKMYPGEFHVATGGQVRPRRVCRRTPAAVLALEVPMDSTVGFTFDMPTEGVDAILPRLLPLSGTLGTVPATFLSVCRLVAMAEVIRADGRHVMKACFQHPVTNEVVFISACNNYIGKEARVPAREEGWFICTADMIAPGRFWNIVKARLHASM